MSDPATTPPHAASRNWALMACSAAGNAQAPTGKKLILLDDRVEEGRQIPHWRIPALPHRIAHLLSQGLAGAIIEVQKLADRRWRLVGYVARRAVFLQALAICQMYPCLCRKNRQAAVEFDIVANDELTQVANSGEFARVCARRPASIAASDTR